MKLVAIIGSPLKEKSNCFKIINQITSKLRKNIKDLEVDTIFLSDCNIKNTTACLTCFSTGLCPIEDELNSIIKIKLKDTDCIILSSPVYFHNVSGYVKTFIDRLAYWGHTLELSGKLGITVTCCSNNGSDIVSNYLQKFFNYQGIVTVGNIHFFESSQILSDIEDDIDKSVKELIYNYNSNDVEVMAIQERIFSAFKDKYLNLGKQDDTLYEYINWKKSGKFNCKTFKEYFNHVKVNTHNVK